MKLSRKEIFAVLESRFEKLKEVVEKEPLLRKPNYLEYVKEAFDEFYNLYKK